MSPYAAKARLNARKAWLTLGRAKEARSTAIMTNDEFLRGVLAGYSRDMVRIARQFMQTAVLYRQMEGRL